MGPDRAPRVACPTCKRPALYSPDNAWRPFCSERCRSIDLGAWASERFRVPADPEKDSDTPDAALEDVPSPPPGTRRARP